MDISIFKLRPIALAVALVFGTICWIIYYKRRRYLHLPALYFPDLSELHDVKKTWKTRLYYLPSYLNIAAFCLMLFAFADPYFLLPIEKPQSQIDKSDHANSEERAKYEEMALPTEGIGIYFLLDQSGSMDEHIRLAQQTKKSVSRLEAMKDITRQFIIGNKKNGLPGRPNDLMGIVEFARVAKITVPLTLDHKALLRTLVDLKTVRYRDVDGTAIGYAIYKTTMAIAATKHYSEIMSEGEEPSYTMLETIMVMVTDGIQNPNPLDQKHPLRTMGVVEAAKYAKEKGIKLYIINIEPMLMHPQLSGARQEFEEACHITGGQFYLAANVESLQNIYKAIDQLEKKEIKGQKKAQALVLENRQKGEDSVNYDKCFISTYLMAMSIASLFLSKGLKMTILKMVP